MENKDQSGGSSSCSSENPNPCPICLGPVVEDSYLDKCFHKFCYNCIVHWTKVVASKHSSLLSSVKCPLCKTENVSIIHGYDGTYFQRHYISQIFGDSFFFSKAHRYRLQSYYTEPGLNQLFIWSFGFWSLVVSWLCYFLTKPCYTYTCFSVNYVFNQVS